MPSKIKIPTKIDGRVLQKVSKKVGKKVLKHFLDNYSKEGQDDKNGNFQRWADRKNKKNKKPLLVKSGRMKKSFNISFSKNGFEIENVAKYAKYHQYGTENLPEREMLYNSKEVGKIIIEEIDKVVLELLGF